MRTCVSTRLLLDAFFTATGVLLCLSVFVVKTKRLHILVRGACFITGAFHVYAGLVEALFGAQWKYLPFRAVPPRYCLAVLRIGLGMGLLSMTWFYYSRYADGLRESVRLAVKRLPHPRQVGTWLRNLRHVGRWLRNLVRFLDGPLGLFDIGGSILFLVLTVYWLELAADMLARRFVSSTSAYAIVLAGFLVIVTFVVAPLRKKFVGSTFWLSAKLSTIAASLGLGLYCSLFHGTSISYYGPGEEKGFLSFALVFHLRRDHAWMASHWFAQNRYRERIIYMIELAFVAVAAVVLLILRYRAAQKRAAV